VRYALQGRARGQGEAGGGRGDDLQGTVALGRQAQGVGEPGGHGDQGPLLDDHGRGGGEDVDGGRPRGGHGNRRDAGREGHDLGGGGLRRPDRAVEHGGQTPGEGTREPSRFGDGGGGAGLGPPHGPVVPGGAEQTLGLAGDLDQDGCLDGHQRTAVGGAELHDRAVGQGADPEIGSARVEPGQQSGQVRHLRCERDDVLGHGASSVASAVWMSWWGRPRRTSVPRPGGCWVAYRPGNSCPSVRSPVMTSAAVPVSRSVVSSGSYSARDAPAARRATTKCKPMSWAEETYGRKGDSGCRPAVLRMS